MPELLIVRHAKSSWKFDQLTDFERPLNERGRSNAPEMAKRLSALNFHHQNILSSPALRALSTARTFASSWGYSPEVVRVNSRIYEASANTLFDVIRQQADSDQLALFGHNPGISELASRLLKPKYKNTLPADVPTCAVTLLKISAPNWKNIDWQTADLLHYDYPKNAA